MIYLLDTNVVIALINDKPLQLRRDFARVEAAGHHIVVSTIVLHELWYGVARSERPQAGVRSLRNFLAGGYTIVPFDNEDAEAAGNIRGDLAEAGKLIGPYDILIAGQAIRRNATLVTANEKEFARIKGLKWENWLK